GLHDACDAALAAGTLVVAAAGNDDANELFYPADYGSVLAVAAVDSASARASFSNFGPSISLSGPGVNVPSTFVTSVATATWSATDHTGAALDGSAIVSASGNAVFCGIGDTPGAFPAAVAGNIAHIRRGTLTFQAKVQSAIDAGAIGVIISNNVAGAYTGTLNQAFPIPVVGITQADGDDLQAHDGVATSIAFVTSHTYANLSGTSMACPHVAGVAALLFGAVPSASPAQVRTAMEQTAVDLGDPGRDDNFGYGLVQANAAIQYLLTHLGCRGDFDQSGAVSVQDLFDYLAYWFPGNPRADFDGVGGVTQQDLFDFLAAWFAGCQ
ncbi:MAG: S8 family serine peptidase, partial [Jatrophihabitantaceae bacterium]